MDRIERYRTRFTLIELLAVVALISLLMAIGVPAFSRMIRGSRVDECARNIKLGLEQAQMRAASERRYVAVIFPNGSGVNDAVKPYRLGGFRTAYVKKNGTDYDFVGWVDGSAWSNAPNGAILVKAVASTGDIPSADSGLTGGPTGMDNDLTGVGNLQTVKTVKDDSGGDLGDSSAIIFKSYGGVVSDSKLYLIVSEAVVDGTDIKYPNPNMNFKVLKINNLTGRVEFYE